MKAPFLLAMLLCLPAITQAESVRCGSRIIARGSSSAEVAAFCGEPTRVDKSSTYLNQYDIETWIYNFGPNQLMERIRIENGIVGRTLTYLRMDKHGRVDRKLTIQPPWAAMIHDIAITSRHVVAFICPAVFDFSKPGPPVTWQPDRGTEVAVIPRDATSASQVTWIHGAPFFQFHTVNAFEDGHRIEVVVPWYDSFSFTARAKALELHRLTIDLEQKTMRDERLDDQPCEFGRINEAYLGRPFRYGYVGLRSPRPGESPQTGAFEAFARYDLADGRKVVHQFSAGQTICEPVFVADPHGKTEEDGFILSFVHDLTTQEGLFVILDARDLGAAPLATVRLPRRVPAGLHGSWIPANASIAPS